MKNKHFFSITTLLLLLLVSCSNTDGDIVETQFDTDSQTTSAVTEAPLYTIAEHDFSGEAFNILNDAPTLVESENGDVLNDAKYQMEKTVEEALNVTITETKQDRSEMVKYVNQLVASGDTTFDTVAVMDRFALQCAMENLVLPMQDISTIHMSEPYWGGVLNDEMTINNNTFFGINSSSLSTFDRVSCCLINTNLAAAYNYQIPFDDIDAGAWTYEDLYALRGMATQDLNGDGVFDMSDRYTFGTFDFRDLSNQLMVSMGEVTVEKNADDIPYVAIYDDERFVNVMQAIYDLCYSGPDSLTGLLNLTDNFRMDNPFIEGNVLVQFARFAQLSLYREMEDDFTILPMPKYDEAQESYMSRTYDATFYMIPTTQDDVEFSGAVLDALSMVGYYDMLPVYVETVLQGKIARDEKSQEYLQLCFDTRTIDMGLAYLNEFFNGDMFHNKVLSGSSMKLASYLTSIQKRADKTLSNIVEKFIEQ